MTNDFLRLPENLPPPVDGGGARHLTGLRLPDFALPATTGETVSLAQLGNGRAVVFAYPRTGRPGEPLPAGWDDIPGARGCTPQTCAFRDLHREFQTLGASLYGLSTNPPAYQKEMAERLHVPFPILSDEHLRLTKALGLPTFQVAGMVLLQRLTLVISASLIEHVFYPVFPSDKNAGEVAAWLRATPRLETGA